MTTPAKNAEGSNRNAEWSSRLHRDDDTVLAELDRTLGPCVERSLLRRFGDCLRNSCEDIVCEGLFRLWRSRRRYDPAKGSLLGYWCAITRNLAISQLRNGKRRPRFISVLDLDALVSPRKETVTPGEETSPFAGEDTTSVVRRIFNELSDAERRILAAFLSKARAAPGEWTAALARELRCRPNTIRVRKKRLIQKLRARFGPTQE
jgi:RNA polymerase sigma factor (sigma-70 family)